MSPRSIVILKVEVRCIFCSQPWYFISPFIDKEKAHQWRRRDRLLKQLLPFSDSRQVSTHNSYLDSVTRFSWALPLMKVRFIRGLQKTCPVLCSGWIFTEWSHLQNSATTKTCIKLLSFYTLILGLTFLRKKGKPQYQTISKREGRVDDLCEMMWERQWVSCEQINCSDTYHDDGCSGHCCRIVLRLLHFCRERHKKCSPTSSSFIPSLISVSSFALP